jgi:hypothetical protein
MRADPAFALVIRGKYVDHLADRQIGAQIGASPATVRARLCQARSWVDGWLFVSSRGFTD